MLARDLGPRSWLRRMLYSGDINQEKSCCGAVWPRLFFSLDKCISAIWSAMNRRQNNRALLALLALLIVASACSLASSGNSAKKLYAQGQAAEAKEDPITAYEDYYQAWEKEPKNLRYKTAYERLRFQAAYAHVERGEKLFAQGDTTGALTEYMRALEIDPSNELAHQDIQKARDKASTIKPNQETSIPENK